MTQFRISFILDEYDKPLNGAVYVICKTKPVKDVFLTDWADAACQCSSHYSFVTNSCCSNPHNMVSTASDEFGGIFNVEYFHLKNVSAYEWSAGTHKVVKIVLFHTVWHIPDTMLIIVLIWSVQICIDTNQWWLHWGKSKCFHLNNVISQF